MRLVYKDSTITPVSVGDVVFVPCGTSPNGKEAVVVDYFREPSHAGSEGKVCIRWKDGYIRECYVSIIGAEWIEREDRGWKMPTMDFNEPSLI